MNWKMAKLVGMYICRHGSSSRRSYLIANYIARETSSSSKMEPDKFVDAIRPILRMAAIEFTKAVFETKFMDTLYGDSHYKKLESGIEQICVDLSQKVFGKATKLDKKEWMQQAMTHDLEWLFKLESVRKRVHEVSEVPMLHINEHEAKRLLKRLQNEQDKI